MLNKNTKSISVKPHYNLTKNISENPNICQTSFNGNQLISIYNIPTVVANANINKVKIAIIVAYSWGPNLQSDLEIYWKRNFPTIAVPIINIYTMPGATVKDSINFGWNIEECLDVQMVATANPNANISVVESKSAELSDIINAIQYANQTLNADVISMSFGCDDTTELSNLNSIFSNPQNSLNYKCFCAATGDNNNPSWPAVSSSIFAVGGTSLVWDPTPENPTASTEYTWKSAGCGYSLSVPIPIYQNLVNKTSKRVIPDISMVANSITGVNIVCNKKWNTVGGTSVSTPLFAGILSIINQQRLNSKKKPFTTVYLNNNNNINNVQSYFYKYIYESISLRSSCFKDVKIGTDGNYEAKEGYDIATGLGSPNVKKICNELINL
jgi:subtilase family serine protease